MDIDYSELSSLDTIRYRPLTREDFKGTKPPEVFAAVADRLGAATCAHLILPPAKLLITNQPSATGEASYEVIVETLEFYAEMDRSCSWWNQNFVGLREDYVLQHEQIHFAIFEVEARRLNAEVPAFKKQIRSTASSSKEAQALAQQKLNAILEDAIAVVMQRSRDFDADTSLGYQPEKQKQWFTRVHEELAEHAPAR